jgi:hypothetical protein
MRLAQPTQFADQQILVEQLPFQAGNVRLDYWLLLAIDIQHLRLQLQDGEMPQKDLISMIPGEYACTTRWIILPLALVEGNVPMVQVFLDSILEYRVQNQT